MCVTSQYSAALECGSETTPDKRLGPGMNGVKMRHSTHLKKEAVQLPRASNELPKRGDHVSHGRATSPYRANSQVSGAHRRSIDDIPIEHTFHMTRTAMRSR